MFPKAIVFFFALVLAEAAITNRVKREVLEEENAIENDVAINYTKPGENWKYKNCCICCDDVHCKTFDLRPIRLKGICPANSMAADLSDIVEVEVETVAMPGVTSGNKIGKVTVIYKGLTYIIDKDCNVWLKNGFLLVKLVHPPGFWENGDVYIIWFPNKVYLVAKHDEFYVWRDCNKRCVEVCVGPSFYNNTEGICANNNGDPADDMKYPNTLFGYWQYSRDWYQLDTCKLQGPGI